MSRYSLPAVLVSLFIVWGAAAGNAGAQAGTSLVLAQPPDNQSWTPGGLGGGIYNEVADDFVLNATITRIVVRATACSCGSGWVTGVVVRFYDWQNGVPTTLLQTETMLVGGAGFASSPSFDEFDLTLQQPFVANGHHAVSIQPLLTIGSTYAWGVKTSGGAQPLADAAKHRGAASGSWGLYQSVWGPIQSNMSIDLWGMTGLPPVLGTDPLGVWTEAPVPSPLQAVDVHLHDVEVISSNDVWAIGDATVNTPGPGTTEFNLAAHWDGSAWTQVPIPSPMPFTNSGGVGLNSIEAAGPNDIWAAGTKLAVDLQGFTDQQVLIMHWDGMQWTEISAPVTQTGGAYIDDIAVVGPNDVWFVGRWTAVTNGGLATWEALAMHWDGATITRHATPFPPSIIGYRLTAAVALATDDVWAVGGGAGASAGLASLNPYMIHWDGSSWSMQTIQLPTPWHDMMDVAATPGGDVFAIGSATLHWDGSTWNQMPIATGFSIHAIETNDIYVAGPSGIRHWDGTGWTLVETFDAYTSSGPGAFTIRAIDGANFSDLHVVGSKLSLGDYAPFAARIEPHALDLGLGSAGANGMPLMWSIGAPVAGELVQFNVVNAAPNAPAVMIASLTRVDLPIHGIVIVPALDLLLPFSTGAFGNIQTGTFWPAGVFASGSSLFLQTVIMDSMAPTGISATNGLELRVP